MIGSNGNMCPNCGENLRPTTLFCPQCGTAVLSSVSNILQISMMQLLSSVKPGQAEVMRRCAIPRWFDVEILGVLRDRQDGSNQKILDQLESYSFVRRLSDARFAYSDDVRALLLEDWRQRPDDLRPIQKRLYNYFERRMGSTSNENKATWNREIITYDLLLASTTAAKDQQQSDNPWIMLQSTVQARVARALLRFRSLFESAYNAHRMAEAEAILIAAEEQATILAPTVRDWLIYYRGNINHAALHLPEAIANYQHLLSRPELEAELRGLCLISLGDVQVENGAWTAAINSYQAALDLPKLDQTQIADAHLGIADAYNELAISAGGWHLARRQKTAVLRWLSQGFQTIALLPMLILVSILRRLGAAVPPARILLRYQNWLLARIFRASREEVQAAYAVYKERNDADNMARCEMRLLDIDVLFGSIPEAVALGRKLLANTATDTYRQAKLRATLARATLAAGDVRQAQAEAEQALAVFQAVDDGRWEARTLTTLGRIYAHEGQSEQALTMYKQGLDRALAIGSVLSRERILYELRVWRRTQAKYPPEIDTILDNTPSQRFVARFPRFLLPYLQIGQTVFIPGIFLLAAIFAPSLQAPGVLRTPTNMLIPAPDVFTFPWYRMLISPLLVFLLMAVGYAVLGLVVLWRMPLTKLRQNQPDIIVLHPTELVHFDQHGVEADRIKWQDVTSFTTADRMLWRRPMPVFSRMFLATNKQVMLRIDGITSWYGTVRKLLKQRTAAAGASFSETNYDMSLLRSIGGVVMGFGLVLLTLMVASVNGWIPDLARSLPPTIYAIAQQLAYSGLLMITPVIYWTVIRPLRLMQEFELDRRIPLVIMLIALGLVVLFFITNGAIVRVPVFSVTLFITAVFVLTEVGYQLVVRRGRGRTGPLVRIALQSAMLALGLLLVRGPLQNEFFNARSHAYQAQQNYTAAAQDRFREINQTSRVFGEPQPIEQAVALTNAQQWAAAQNSYQAIITNPGADPLTKALSYHNLAQSLLNQCLNAQNCTRATAEQIMANSELALNGLRDPIARSTALVTQGNAYVLLGDSANANARYQEAQLLTPDAQQKTQIQALINQLNR